MPGKILIVENDEDSRTGMAAFFEAYDFEVRSTDGTDEAIGMALGRQFVPDLGLDAGGPLRRCRSRHSPSTHQLPEACHYLYQWSANGRIALQGAWPTCAPLYAQAG